MEWPNVELHRRFYRALNGRDVDALVALCHPSVEVRSSFAAVGGATYQGHEGVRRWMRDTEESWGGSFRVEPDAFYEIGEHTMILGVLKARGSQSGLKVAMPAIGVARWRDGLCVSHKGYVDKSDALAELGVSEEALEPIKP
jgi:ketosteroid isomerase-like protein